MMSVPAGLPDWMAEVHGAFPNLSAPQAEVLALYSAAMVQAGRCGLSCTAEVLSQWLAQPFDTTRERLRDWYCSADQKTGSHRRQIEVSACFGPLLHWILQDWEGEALPVALDATTLGQRFTVLAVCLLYRSGAIPIAWKILPATKKGAWKPHWLELLRQLQQIVPESKQVIVLADRGLYAKWLYQAIVDLHWHPFLRLNPEQAVFCAAGEQEERPLAPLLPAPGSCYQGTGRLFRSARSRLTCTLLARWDEGYEDGWFVATDLPPAQSQVAWYGLRSWVERGFKLDKSGGWNWQETRTSDPAHAERIWLAMAVASLYVLRYGTEREQQQTTRAKAPAPPTAPQPTGRRRRILSVFRMGLIAAQLAMGAVPATAPTRLEPEPWPTSTPRALAIHPPPAAQNQPP